MHPSIGAMKDYARLMNVHLDNILNHSIHHITSASAEDINSKIALMEEMSFCYRNREHLRNATHFMCGNLQLYQ